MALILADFNDSIGTITLNNDGKRNALSGAVIHELIKALNEMVYHPARVIVLRANKGAAVWSSGFNIAEFPKPGRDPLGYDDPLEQAIRAIQRCPAPVIAMLEGSVWGGAVELAMVCDILIGTEKTSFAITPARLGVAYNPTGMLHVINMIGLTLAREMFITGLPVPAVHSPPNGPSISWLSASWMRRCISGFRFTNASSWSASREASSACCDLLAMLRPEASWPPRMPMAPTRIARARTTSRRMAAGR